MSPNNFVELLASVLPRKDISKVLNALRLNSLLWEDLGDKQFSDTLINWDGSDRINFWIPSNLAIIRTTMEDGIPSNKRKSIDVIDDTDTEKVLGVLEKQLINPKVPENFLEVSYYSLGLFQKFKQNSSWHSIFRDLFSSSIYSENAFIKIWGPVIICLYGMVDDFSMISKILFNHFPFCATFLLIHKTYLCNLVSETNTCNYLKGFIKELSVSEQYRTIRHLSLMGYLESRFIVSSIAANNMDINEPNPFFLLPTSHEYINNNDSQKANLVELIGMILNKKDFFDESQYRRKVIENSGLSEISRSDYYSEDTIQTETYSILKCSAPDTNPTGRIVFTKENAINPSNSYGELNCDHLIIPFRKIVEAEKHLTDGNASDVQSIAKKSVEKMINTPSELFFEEIDDSIYELDLIKPLSSLIKLDLIEEASLLANYLIEIFPNQQELLFQASKIFDLLNQQQLSLSYAILGAYCDLGDFGGNRYLADLYEQKGLWEFSYLERYFIVENDINYSIDDLLALANTALYNKKYDLVIEMGKRVFENLPNNGLSYLLVGEAFTAIGDYDQAIPHLTRATLLLENDERPWKSLINVYRFTNNQHLLYSTIINATRLIPDSALLKLSHAKYYIDHENFEEAHTLLGEVRELKQTVPSTILELGKFYEETGDLIGAKEVYVDGLHSWPLISDFPYKLGLLLIMQGKNQEAGVILIDFLSSNPNDVNTWILYLQTQMGDIHSSLIEYVFNPSESGLVFAEMIKPTCERILLSRPNDPLFNLLMAEIHLIESQEEEALQIYRNINQYQYQLSREELWRMKAGYGKAELDCSNAEAGIAIIKEVVAENPDCFDTTRILAEAFLKTSLNENALELGLHLLEKNNDDPKVIDWYFEMIRKISDKKMGANFIDAALRIIRTNPDIYISLAGMHIQNDLLDEAEYVLVNYLNKEELTTNQLQSAAFLFYKLGKLDDSWQLINLGIQINTANNLNLLYDAAGILINQGKYFDAINYLDGIIDNRPDEICVITLKSDLLSESGDVDGAIVNITLALDLLLKSRNAVASLSNDYPFRYLTPEWNKSLENISDIYARNIFLNRRLGNLQNAFNLAEESIEKTPDHLPTRYRAIDLAFELLDFQQALEWASFVDDYQEPEIIDHNNENLGEYLNALVGICCLMCDYELASGHFAKAEHWLNKIISIDHKDPRIRALILRFRIRDGERITANNEFQNILDNFQILEFSNPENQIIGNNFEINQENGHIHTFIDTALDLYQWEMAYHLAKEELDTLPSSPLRHFYLLKVIAHSLEKQALCNDLQCVYMLDFLEKIKENYLEFVNPSIDFIENNSKLPEKSLGNIRIIFDLLANSTGEIDELIHGLQMISEDILMSSIYRKMARYEALNKLANYQETCIDVLVNAALGLSKTNLDLGYQLAKVCVYKDPDNPFGQLVYSRICEELGNYREAYESIKMALINYPDEPNWHFIAGRLAEKITRNAESIYHYQKSLNYLPDNVSIYLNLGQAYLKNNQAELAIEVFEKCRNEIPDNYQLNLGFAKAYALLGNYHRANTYINKSIEVAPNYYEPLLVGATMAYDSGNILDASDLAEKMYIQHPDDIEIILAYSILQEKLGRPERAVKILNEVMAKFEFIPLEIVLKCGELVDRLEGPNQAINVLGKKKDQFNTKPEFLGAYAKYHFEGEFIQQAELYAYEVLKLNPNLPGINKLLADIQRKYGFPDKVEYYLREEINSNPKNCLDSYLDLGNILYQKKEFSQSIKIYQRAMDTYPEDFLPYYRIALIFKEFKDYVAAEKMLTKAVEFAADNIQIRRELAAITALNFVHNSQEVNYINDL